MSGMFLRCSSIKYLEGISNWDTKNVTHMSGMFNGCGKNIILPYNFLIKKKLLY